MCRAASPVGAIVANVSISGSSSRSGASCAEPLVSSPSQAASTTTNERPRSGSGICSNGGTFSRRPSEVISSGTLASTMPRLEYLGRPLLRPEQHARIELGNREQLQLQRGHHGEAAAATAQRPEKLGLASGVGSDLAAVRGDDLGGPDALAASPWRRTIQLAPPPSA